MANNIFEFVTTEKTNFEAGIGVPIAGNWYWRMYDHNNYTLLMKNGQFPVTQTKLGERPKKNIILPILNVAHRTEGFDVKDTELYVEAEDSYHLSFLARKFHYNWAIENKMDTFIDEVVEGCDYGYVLVKNVNNKRPEVVQPQQIAFCDQTDILSGTIALRHQYSVDQLIQVGEQLGWYQDKINEVVMSARTEKENPQTPGQVQDVPDKSIEVFEVHGTFPNSWLKDNETYKAELKASDYSKQLHIIVFTKDKHGNKTGICLFKGKEEKEIFKLLVLHPIYGRAAGRGRVEELFESQIWTDFNTIHMQNMLEQASKVVHVTDDPGLTTRNNTKNLKGGEFLTLEEGRSVNQLNNQPVNINLFDRANAEWEQHARVVGSASDPALGLNPVSGTPLGTTEIVTVQGQGIHEYRRGKIATFLHEIYTDWVIGYLAEDLNKESKWTDELTVDELNYVIESITESEFAKYQKELVLNGEDMPEEAELEAQKEQFKNELRKKGGKFLFQILKGEFKDKPLKIRFNIANKQKDLARVADKLSNIFRTIFANPQGFMETMKIPGASKAFNQMLEASGLSQMDFTAMPKQPEVMEASIPSPIQPPIPQQA